MDPSVVIQLVILVVFLILSAFFSSSETALTTVNKIRIRTMAEEGDRRAEILLKVTADSGKMLSAILIGNNLVNIGASSLATTLAIRIFGNAGAGIATGILTVLILIFGEISPKTLATLHAERLALRFAGIIHVLMTVLTPVIFIIQSLAMLFLRVLGVDTNRSQISMTLTELRTIVDVVHEGGGLEEEEKDMLHNVFDFRDALAKEVMIPRIDVTMSSSECSYDELMQIFREDKFTRVPIYGESQDDIIGILNFKDLLFLDEKKDFHLQDLLREPYFTYEHKKVSELFMEMRDSRNSMAIVLDEYGTMAGLITLEDLLEEIVGELRDEYDEDEVDPVQQLSDCEYLVSGSMNLEDLSNQLKLNLESDDNDSIAGYMIEMLDHLPKPGESYTTESGVYMRVRTLSRNRIQSIYIRLPEEQADQ